MTEQPSSPPPKGPSRAKQTAKDVGRTIRLVLGGVVLVLLTLFVVVNTDDVTIKFLVGDVTLPLVVVLAVTAVLGGLIASLFFASRRRGR